MPRNPQHKKLISPAGVRCLHRVVLLDWTRNPEITVHEDYDYSHGHGDANYPVPSLPLHLYLIAAEPLQAWEDFKSIGYHGCITR